MKFWQSSALVLASVFVLGCEESAPTPDPEPTPEATAETSLQRQARTAGESLTQKANEANAKLQDQAGEAIASGQRGLADAANEMKAKGEGVLAGLDFGSLKEGMSLTPEQADAVIEKVRGLIGEDRIAQAQQWVEKLESLDLPEGYAEKVESLKDMLN
jgi:hypothetical protein